MLTRLPPALLLLLVCMAPASAQKPPNVLLVMTDDQGYGDLGYHGNPLVHTPTLDRLAGESVRFTDFYVSPVCAPTRSSLMTGRYSLRTGVRDTYNGGAIMAGSEYTLAELLRDAGYRTGIFGKWHLGDNYPSRPSDQGFDESLVHLGGGMGQPGDFTTYPRHDSSYFDPVLWHNDSMQAYDGYCTNIFSSAATDFIGRDDGRPWFCYLSLNAPHTPLQVPQEYLDRYATADLSGLTAINERLDEDAARRVYAMVTNIDDNLGRLLERLDATGQRENTVVIFLTDNGPQQWRYTAGMRGRKGQVYQGGVRVPFFVRYPAGWTGGREIAATAAHIDVLPTLADLARTQVPTNWVTDGRSLLPLLTGERQAWPDERSLFLYWTRKYPEPYRNMALRRGSYKLVGMTDYDAPLDSFALYDLAADPGEDRNLIRKHPQVAVDMHRELSQIYAELITSPNLLDPPRIRLDPTHEHPLYLNRNDAGGQRAIWTQEEVYGTWALDVAAPGSYDVECVFFEPLAPGGRLVLEFGPRQYTREVGEVTERVTVPGVYIPGGAVDFVPFYEVEGRRVMPWYVRLTHQPNPVNAAKGSSDE